MMLRRDAVLFALPGRPLFEVRANSPRATFTTSLVISSDAERLE